jgi:hypothetical protein
MRRARAFPVLLALVTADASDSRAQERPSATVAPSVPSNSDAL